MDTQSKTATLDEIEQNRVCLNCGMPQSQWKGNQRRGYRQEEKSFCCEGCAENTGCTCADEDERD